jgi:AraC family transcriptional regulator
MAKEMSAPSNREHEDAQSRRREEDAKALINMETRLPPGSSFGTVVRHRAAAGFTLSETTYAPGLLVPRHAHEYTFLYAVLEGSYTETFGGTILTPKPFALVLHPAGEVHSHHCREGSGRCFNMDLEPRWVERVNE